MSLIHISFCCPLVYSLSENHLLIEQNVVPALIWFIDHEGFQVGNRLSYAIMPAHRYIFVFVTHHIVITDHRQFGNHLLPGDGTPAWDAEAEPTVETLPVPLRDQSG